MPDYVMGVDLGQTRDYSAVTVLEVTRRDTGKTESTLGYDGWSTYNVPVKVYENLYAANHLERLPIGTPYPKQVARIKELYEHLSGLTYMVGRGILRPEQPEVSLVVDQTGVGRPVLDMLRQAGLSPIAVTITGGDTVSRDRKDYRVPKRDLVSTVQVLLDAERLKIARALPEAQTLIDELLAFKVSISLKGHDSYGNDAGMWRENPHDDLVLATALACWWGEHRPPPPRRPVRSYTTSIL